MLQQVLSCVTGGVIRTSGYRNEPAIKWLELSSGQLVPLAGGIKRFSLQVQQRYTLVHHSDDSHDRWGLAVTEYRYTVASQETGDELLAFHWHPRQIRPPFPHLHLETGLGLQPGFIGLHVPTGWVTIAAVIWFLIEELGVRPRRPDWQQILQEFGTSDEDATRFSVFPS